MGALGNPKAWIPYMNAKECTQQICSLPCPQWCYISFPPPPPYVFPDDKSQTNLTFSPLVIAIIGVLASAFLLVSYYAIVSKYCGNSCSSRRRGNEPPNEATEEEGSSYNNNNNLHNHEFSQHEPWFIRTNGLDEALIKSITLVKYNKEDGLIGITNCSICLGEFLEDDHLRLLPKCSHAFHVSCIDTWLKSHSNCPLCRANIVSIFVQPLHPSPPHDHASLSGPRVVGNDEISSSEEGSRNLLKNPFRSFSDIALRQSSHTPYVKHNVGDYVIRRSISMDHSHETSVSISEISRLSYGEDCQVNNQSMKMTVGESSNSENDGLFRFLVSKHCRGSNVVIPV